MFTASQKRKENIAEYLIYMWNIEDMIRSANLDIATIEQRIIDPQNPDTDTRKQLVGWYESLIDMMRREGVERTGHLQINRNTLEQMATLHHNLLKDPKFQEYAAEFYRTLPYIVELRSRAGDDKRGEIETCFNALYGLMMLRLQHKEVSQPTLDAIRQISKFIATLAYYFKLEEEDKLEWSGND